MRIISKDLRVYQKGREVSRAVFRLSKTLPKDEMYSLSHQIRRAARSIGAQIAEAWGNTGIELWMLRAETPAQFATALRWIQVPVWLLLLSLVGFVRLRLRAGRPWLAWTACALRRVAPLDPYASLFFVATGITPAMPVVVNSRMNL